MSAFPCQRFRRGPHYDNSRIAEEYNRRNSGDAEAASRDMYLFGAGILLDGKRVPPREFWEPPSDEAQERAFSRMIAAGMSRHGRKET